MQGCSVDGCTKPFRARGLCSTHYNQRFQPAWHAPIRVPCVMCDTVVERGNKSDRRHVCSRACWRALIGATRGYDPDRAAVERAHKAGATNIILFSLRSALDRDGWRCQICGVELIRDTTTFAPTMATIDHIVPLRRGGSHTMENVQAACLRCNSAKQDRS